MQLTTVSFPPAEYGTAWILPFTSGGFLYIALVNVVPDLLEESSLRYFIHSRGRLESRLMDAVIENCGVYYNWKRGGEGQMLATY